MFGVETLHCPSSPKPRPPGVMKRPLEKNKTLPGIGNPISGAWNDSPRVYMAPEWALARVPLAVGALNQTFEASKGDRRWYWHVLIVMRRQCFELIVFFLLSPIIRWLWDSWCRWWKLNVANVVLLMWWRWWLDANVVIVGVGGVRVTQLQRARPRITLTQYYCPSRIRTCINIGLIIATIHTFCKSKRIFLLRIYITRWQGQQWWWGTATGNSANSSDINFGQRLPKHLMI